VLLAFLDSLRTFFRIVQAVAGARVIGIEIQGLLKGRTRLRILSESGEGHTQPIPRLLILRIQLSSLPVSSDGIFVLVKKTMGFAQVEIGAGIFRVT
jgi:hypothetical protein